MIMVMQQQRGAATDRDVHRWSWRKDKYCKVATYSNIGAMTWNTTDLIDYDGNQIDVNSQNVSITDAPNNWDPEQPMPFCGTLFPNQNFLDQRDLNTHGVFNEPAPRGPAYANPDFDPAQPPGPDNPASLNCQPWTWMDPHAGAGQSTGLQGGLACFQPMVNLEVEMKYMDN